jgi:GNAT superfamily N-acetyltransferase
MAAITEIEFRAVRADDPAEYRAYLRLFWDIPLGLDRYFTRRTDAFVEEWMQSARARETDSNTFSGIALHRKNTVGVHILRAFEEYERLGAHIAGLWVREECRGIGIARRLKQGGEAWARRVGAEFLNTNVQTENERMLRINERAGFTVVRLNMRKGLR